MESFDKKKIFCFPLMKAKGFTYIWTRGRIGGVIVKAFYGAFQIAFVYVGTVIGAGFATGKEIVEFFTQYGFVGFVGILVSGYLFIMMGTKTMKLAIKLKAQSYEELNEYLFGKKLAFFFNIAMMMMLICVSGVMLAGAGALFEEQLGISKQLGIWLTIFVGLIVMINGTKGLFAVNSFVVPLMITFNLIVFFISAQTPEFFSSVFSATSSQISIQSVASPFAYTAFNLALAQAVLVPVAAEIDDERTIEWGGIIGGLFLTIILLSSHFVLLQLPDATSLEIPMASIMNNVAYGISGIYLCIIYGEIFTSIIGNMYGLERQLSHYLPIRPFLLYITVFLIAFCLSQLHYGRLLSLLYPLFGYFSFLFFFLLWVKPIK
jgi:uncharacterized membrane protein YkvI